MEPKANENHNEVLRMGAKWQDLRLYQKSDVLYQITFAFCNRFLPKHGDRTVDQMVQAARSGKQNIVEGSEDGKTSTEMELKLLNVARASISELKEDYKDYINVHHLELWTPQHPRFQQMQQFARSHNLPSDYTPYFEHWSQEEYCNVALTLCYQTDTMLNRYLKFLEDTFVSQGGIKERMYEARTGYRQAQDKELQQLRNENADLKKQLAVQKQAYEDLKQKALTAYNNLKQQLEEMKKEK